jgi:hypothetical protein
MTSVSIPDEIERLTTGQISAEVAVQLRDIVLAEYQNDLIHRRPGDVVGTSKRSREWCTRVVCYFLANKWTLPAKSLLYELWDRLAAAQRASQKRLARAHISQLLTEVSHFEGALGEAFRWAMLTQADDVLGNHDGGGGHGRHWLYGIFGLSEEDRAHIDSLAVKCREEADTVGWGMRAGFAEEVIRRLGELGKVGSCILQRHVLIEEFHLTPAFLTSLVDELISAPSRDAKGTTLENVAFYLFSLIPGCIPRRNVLDVDGASEHDLVIENFGPVSSILDSSFGREFLVECKNWERGVGAEAVGYFLLRMALTHCRFGVMLAMNGITKADNGEKFATALVRRAYHESSIACIVLDLNDLKKLAAREALTLNGLMMDRLHEFRLGK